MFVALAQNTGGSSTGAESASFAADLQTTLVPRSSGGDATPTYTRATTAYQTDFEGKLNLLPSGAARMQGARITANLIANDLLLDFSDWLGTGGLTQGISDPEGGLTATTLTMSGSGERYIDSVAGQITPLASGATLRSSIWIKRRTGSGAIRLYDGGDNSTYTDITTAVTSSWLRIAANVSAAVTTGTLNNRLGIRLMTAGDAVDIWYPMSENVVGRTNQAPSEWTHWLTDYGAGLIGWRYFSTLNGNTVASNVVTEATGAAINSSEAACAGGVTAGVVDASGPLGEIDTPSLANVLGTTAAIVRTMADAGWVASNVTVGAATGVDGVASAAASLTATAGNATILYTTVLGAAVRSYVPRVRRKTGTGVVNITVDNGVTWTPMTLTTTYQPIKETTASAANPIIGFRIVTSGDAIEVDFNTLVAGTIAPPTPIPLNVTTAAEVTQYASAGNISATATSLTMQVTPAVDLDSTTVFHWASYVDASNYTAILSDGTNLIARKRIGGSNHDATIAWTRTAGTTAKVGARFDTVNGVDIFLNGAQGTPDTTTTASQIGTNFQVGADGNGANQDYCEHRFGVWYSKSLSNSKMTALTT